MGAWVFLIPALSNPDGILRQLLPEFYSIYLVNPAFMWLFYLTVFCDRASKSLLLGRHSWSQCQATAETKPTFPVECEFQIDLIKTLEFGLFRRLSLVHQATFHVTQFCLRRLCDDQSRNESQRSASTQHNEHYWNYILIHFFRAKAWHITLNGQAHSGIDLVSDLKCLRERNKRKANSIPCYSLFRAEGERLK